MPLTSIMRMTDAALGPVWSRGKIGPALAVPTPSQWKRPPGRPRNPWLSVVSKDMKGVGIPDAMVMAEDRMRWKTVVAELAQHATPKEGMLSD